MLHSLLPTYFHWWNIPVIFLGGLVGESYGCLIGGGSIVMLAAQNLVGVPLRSAIAMDNAAALGTQLGIFSETRQHVSENKKLVLFMMVPVTLGGIVGTWFLLVVSSQAIKYLMIVAVLALLIHSYIAKQSTPPRSISRSRYAILFSFLFLNGIYSNFMGVGEGTFSKFALMSVLGLTFLQSQGLGAAAGIPARIYSLVITAIAGLIVWPYVITFWISTFLAGRYATKFVKRIPDTYLKISLTIISIAFVLYLLFIY